MLKRKQGFYEKYVKRILDIICALLAMVLFCWLYVLIAIVVRIKMGKPIIFKQARPGIIDPQTGQERIFDMYKFRTMTNAKDKEGNLLPDKDRLSTFGKILRATSLDEIPEAFNILRGDMSVIGPRPQLVRDMVFMTDEQRMRHTAKPGLSGLAQVNGRNAVSWEEKFKWDLKYIENITFWNDIKLIIKTVKVAVIWHEGITDGENATVLDYGDALLKAGKVSQEKYDALQAEARSLVKEHEGRA